MSKIIVDSIIHARWVLTMSPKTEVLAHHALVVSDGIIIDLLPSSEIFLNYRGMEELFLDNHILMPGLINVHGHAAMSLLRGFADDYALHEWLTEHIWPLENQHVSKRFVNDGTRLACAEMIQTGTTCFSDMYFYPDAAINAIKQTGMRAQIASTVFDFPSAWGNHADDYLAKGLAAAELAADTPLITFAFGPHAPYSVSDENLIKTKQLADQHDMAIQIHLHETQTEVDEARNKDGMAPIERLDKLNFLDASSQLVHMTALSTEEINRIAELGCSVVHCPKSNLKLSSGIAPVQALLNAGVNVAIGTDGAASNNSHDMFSELQYAALVAKLEDPTAVNAATALELATMGGAKALGIDHIVGSLVRGKQADCIAIDMSGLAQQPLFDPISQLVYTQCGHLVTHSWVNGRALMIDRHLTTIEQDRLTETVAQWHSTITLSQQD